MEISPVIHPKFNDPNSEYFKELEQNIINPDPILTIINENHNVIRHKKSELFSRKKLYHESSGLIPLNKSLLDPNEESISTLNISQIIGKIAINQLPAHSLLSRPNVIANMTPPLVPQTVLGMAPGPRRTPRDPSLATIQPEHLPELADPIVSFIEEVEPHIVIGCDRGGRLFSLAVHAVWRQKHQGKPFPTLDGAIHFARISKTEDAQVLQEKMDEIVAHATKSGSAKGTLPADGEQLRILFLDDWVSGGGTMRLAQQLSEKYGAESYFGTMVGTGGDVTGDTQRVTWVSWHDNENEIGVNYMSTVAASLLAADGIRQTLTPIAVRGERMTYNRRKIQEAARELYPAQVEAAV